MVWIANQLRHCGICGSVFGREAGLCPTCRIFLKGFEDPSPQWRHQLSLKVFSLLRQDGGLDDMDHRLLVLLKDAPILAWRPWAQRLVEARGRLAPPLCREATLVPIPSSTGRPHSQRFAQALQESTGFKIVNGLRLMDPTKGAQKGRSRQERALRRAYWDADLAEGPCPKVPILVDDMITTGQTAQACYEAMGQPATCELWTLFRRPLLLSGFSSAITRRA